MLEGLLLSSEIMQNVDWVNERHPSYFNRVRYLNPKLWESRMCEFGGCGMDMSIRTGVPLSGMLWYLYPDLFTPGVLLVFFPM
jgi:hypothetical protein